MTESRVSFAGGADAVAEAAVLVRRNGFVVIDELVDPALLARCRDEAEAAQPFDTPGADHSRTNPGRSFGAWPIRGALADPAVFANPAIMTLAGELLGPKFVIDSYGAIVSQPGAAVQHPHRDGALFPESRIDPMIPPFALNLVLPLVPMDAVSGSTEFCPGSHRDFSPGLECTVAPTVPVGSALFWDYRVLHRGMANNSGRPRPLLFLAYCRPWWQDAGKNTDFGRADKLVVSRDAHAALDRPAQRLLVRARLIDDGAPVSPHLEMTH